MTRKDDNERVARKLKGLDKRLERVETGAAETESVNFFRDIAETLSVTDSASQTTEAAQDLSWNTGEWDRDMWQ